MAPKRAAALEARGIVTAGEVVFHLPARYQDWRERTPLEDLRAGNIVVVEGDLGKISERPMRGSRWRRLASGWLNVDGRQIRLVWFNLPAYMRGYLPGGERVLVRGRVAANADGGIEIVQPELHRLSDGEPKGIRPVYRLPQIIGQRLFAGLVTRALDEVGDSIRGAIPDELRGEVPTVRDALSYLHDPPPDADFGALSNGDSSAHRALAFDELFAFELALSIERLRSARRVGIALDGSQSLSSKMIEQLPFALTGSQSRARMWASSGDDGADRTARRTALARIRAPLRAARSQACAAHWERDGYGAQPDFARACERRDRGGLRNTCVDTGAGTNARTRARRDRRTASLRRFRSREDKRIGAEGEPADDDGDADSAKPRDELVREPRRIISRRAACWADANRNRGLYRARYRATARQFARRDRAWRTCVLCRAV